MIQGGNPFLTKGRAKEQETEVNGIEGKTKIRQEMLKFN